MKICSNHIINSLYHAWYIWLIVSLPLKLAFVKDLTCKIWNVGIWHCRYLVVIYRGVVHTGFVFWHFSKYFVVYVCVEGTKCISYLGFQTTARPSCEVTKQMQALCVKGGVLEHALACKIARAISQSNNLVTWYTEITIVLESTFHLPVICGIFIFIDLKFWSHGLISAKTWRDHALGSWSITSAQPWPNP